MRERHTIALHIIMPDQVSGPNTSNVRIAESELRKSFDFVFVTQRTLAGGRVNLALLKNLRDQYRATGAHLVHISGLQSSGFHAVLAARLAGCRNILVTVRGFSGDAVGLGWFKRLAFTHVIEPLTLSLSSGILTVCHEAGEQPMVRKRSRKYLGVLHNAAPEVRFDTHAARREFRTELGVAEDDTLVVVSGRMVYDKGVTFVSEAMARVRDSSVKFVLLGDGPYVSVLEREHANLIQQGRLFLLGKRSDVMRILCACDVYLFATLHENLSNSLLEAMAVGLPVVATAVGGNIEVVEHQGNGFLIEPADSDAIVHRVIELCHDSELRSRMGTRSVEIIRERFAPTVVYPRLEAVYALMLKRGSSG